MFQDFENENFLKYRYSQLKELYILESTIHNIQQWVQLKKFALDANFDNTFKI